MFIPIDREDVEYPKLYTKIIDNIKKMIIDGNLKAGDKLPSERDLAELFQVSRVPVREALKILEYIGVLHHIRGRGMYVRGINVEDLIEMIDFALLTPEEGIQDLFEAREATELQAVRLAAVRRTDADLLIMEKTIQNMKIEIEAGRDGAKPSLEFHTAIVRASKNKVLYQIHSLFLDLLELSRHKTLSTKERRLHSVNDHEEILKKITLKDAEGSARIMLEHLRTAEEEFKSLE